MHNLMHKIFTAGLKRESENTIDFVVEIPITREHLLRQGIPDALIVQHVVQSPVEGWLRDFPLEYVCVVPSESAEKTSAIYEKALEECFPMYDDDEAQDPFLIHFTVDGRPVITLLVSPVERMLEAEYRSGKILETPHDFNALDMYIQVEVSFFINNDAEWYLSEPDHDVTFSVSAEVTPEGATKSNYAPCFAEYLAERVNEIFMMDNYKTVVRPRMFWH